MNNINLNTITFEAFRNIHDVDQNLIGSPNYIGIAYFWHYAYRHYLRDASIYKRKKVHQLFLLNNLNVSEASDMHLAIIKKIIKQVN